MKRRLLHLFIITIGTLLIVPALADDHPVDIVNGREYEGQYTALQSGQSFGYLQGREGRVIVIFYGSPNRDSLNSVDIFLMDPRYQDGRMILVQLKQIIEIGDNAQWINDSHHITYSTIWRQRQQDSFQVDNISTEIYFSGLEGQEYEDVSISIHMKGDNFQFIAQLSYYNQLLSTLGYSLFVSAVVAVQIFAGYKLVRIMDAPNFVFTAKMSLLTLSLCNIEDFSQTMNHIQYIMGSESGYLFFILPSLAYIVLFIIFDMKMLFLVWRSHNIRNVQNPQLLRKRLTAFYIQFYLGLFLYLTLTYFFSNDEWMIILSNLILIPQIIHNVRLGNNPGFNPYYIFGFIGARLFLPLYERLCPQNRFSVTPHLPLTVILVSLYVLEVVLLYLQSKLGSRFFVPKRFLPNYFNYRNKLKLSQETKETECTICLQNLFQISNDNLNQTSIAESLMQQPMHDEITVMTTPCRHHFHQECLSQWMQVKLQCPTCRTQLPQL